MSAKIETFSKISDFLDHLKALNENISEWAPFLNLAKQFQKNLNFNTYFKKVVFSQNLKGTYISRITPKIIFLMGFLQFSEIKSS